MNAVSANSALEVTWHELGAEACTNRTLPQISPTVWHRVQLSDSSFQSFNLQCSALSVFL